MHDIFEFGALIISLEAKMLLAQWQDLIYFLFSENNGISCEYYMERQVISC